MAGSSPFPGFGDRFRNGIRFAMEMGAPPSVEEQAVFYFPSQLVYQSPADSFDVDESGVPFDPSIPVTRNIPPPVRVLCAVDYFDAQDIPTEFGLVTPSRAEITLLDEEYEKVKGCAYVVLGGERFVYRKTEFPAGLFDVGLYTMHFVAENDR